MEPGGSRRRRRRNRGGDWPVKPTPPFVPGHEGVGIVQRAGRGVTRVKEGDYCLTGWETLCERQQNSGYSVDGGWAEYALASGGYVGRVPDGIDPFEAAPLTCAGVTTYKAVKMSGARSSDLVAIFGVGGLGHLALQYALIAGAQVVAVDLFDEKLAMAKELGAAYTVNAREEDPAAAIKALGGADAAISLAVSPKAFEQAYGSLRRGGTLVFVGLPADNHIQLPIFETVLNGTKVLGSIVGTRIDLAEVFELHAAGKTEVVYERRQLEDINSAIHEVETGQVKARVVFDLQ
jgi:alcohol dehydrogenase, propanol-preferring